MYKRILLPIDGSDISHDAAKAGIDFAKYLGAEVVLLNVTQPFSSLVGFDGISAAYAFSNEDYESSAKKEAQSFFADIEAYAKEQGVASKKVISSNSSVAECLVEVAKQENCDLIHIASHGRSGISKLLLGSVTAKVLGLAETSILVYRKS
ncbi:universal stress protein [Basilea psittacipulmonis]|uniref:Universal stress protein n=1 Tax=Basilea psittacipulmonis DSM 24701 TaxID=1072685 RepID=A0A077DEB3_9BURK|nr:universal stress protein [Basilea psittacipulmonis]AIL33049.1 universal stress protein [Basilea psittacipulmonis DSM 24701]